MLRHRIRSRVIQRVGGIASSRSVMGGLDVRRSRSFEKVFFTLLLREKQIKQRSWLAVTGNSVSRLALGVRHFPFPAIPAISALTAFPGEVNSSGRGSRGRDPSRALDKTSHNGPLPLKELQAFLEH